MLALPGRKTVVLQVCVNVYLPTDGSTSFSYLDVDVAQLERWGPAVNQIRVLTVTSHRMPLHAWAVFASWSNTDRTWSTPTALHTELTGDGETVEAAFSTPASYAGRRMKLLLGARNTSGSIRNTAVVSAWAILDLET